MSKKYPLLDDEKWLYLQYSTNRLGTTEIGEIVGCPRVTVWNALKRHNIEIRTNSEAQTKYFELRDREHQPRFYHSRYEDSYFYQRRLLAQSSSIL